MLRHVTVVDELATVLFALSPGSLTTGAVTAQITNELTTWALSRGWLPRAEARVHIPHTSAGQPRLGYVDLMIRRGASGPDLAIEIDSADKPWSLAKLRHAAAAGMIAIWVRWGDEVWAGVYDDIDVIQLQATRRSAPRPSREMRLTFWS